VRAVENSVTAKLVLFAVPGMLALPWIHPFGPVRQQHSDAPVPDLPFAQSCLNCHSEKTQWPLYSRIPVVGWMLERDVAEAREHMNLSRWSSYSTAEQKDLLARIAAEVRSDRMPPARYTMLHPGARLSDAERQAIYKWTADRRHVLRMRGIKQVSPESLLMPQ